MANYCISVDWLQLFCHTTITIEPGNFVGKSLRMYNVEDTGNSTQVFSNVYVIKRMDYPVATLCLRPKSSVIDCRACTLKLENRVLYHQGFIELLFDVIYALQLEYKGVTRLDLAYDCNILADGTEVSKFLYDCVFSPCNQVGHTYRKGSRKMIINCNRGAATGAEITALRWGSRSSAVCAYAYNKSLEMIEQKIKPWIVETWEKNGLVHQVFDKWNKLSEKQQQFKINNGLSSDYIKRSVWRFEISIKAEGRDILNMRDGELFCLSPRYIESQEKIEAMFWAYAEKYLCFYKSTGQKNPRDYPRYFPLCRRENNEVSDMPISMNKFADTGRTEIVAANVLDKLAKQYADMGEQYGFALTQCIEFLRLVSGNKKTRSRVDGSEYSLARMVAEERLSMFDGLYMQLIDKMYEDKKEANPDQVYNFTESLLMAIKEADMREWAESQSTKNTQCF